MIFSTRSAQFLACTSTMQDEDVDVEALTPRKKTPRKKAERATVLNFTATEEADIITRFQENPVLYDSKLKDYRNRAKKIARCMHIRLYFVVQPWC